MAHRLVVVVGVPPVVENLFGPAFSKLASQELVEPTVLSTHRLDVGYTEGYANGVYDKLVYKLKGHGSMSRESLLATTNLIVLFLQRSDGSEAVLFRKFGVEAFVTPMLVPQIADMAVDTRSQRRSVVGKLIRGARGAIRHARRMLGTIHEDLNGRENKTCLLLPPKTFGDGFLQVQSRVWDAATNREDVGRFSSSLKTLKIPKSGNHYVGQGGSSIGRHQRPGPAMGLPLCGRTITNLHASSAVA